MNIKAQGLLNAAKWIEEEYGTSTLRDVLRACSPEVRERYVSAIAINWHPMSELVELLRVADTTLGRGDGKIAEHIGAAGARANLKGVVVRFAFYVANPDFLMKRVGGLWSQFNDEGTMRLLYVKDYGLEVEVVGLTAPEWLFCCTITGWCREVALAVGVAAPHARHVQCRGRGAARCVWEVRSVRKLPGERESTPNRDSSGKIPAVTSPSSKKIPIE